MVVNEDGSLVDWFLFRTGFGLLLFLYNGGGPFISKNIVVSALRTGLAFCRLRLWVFDTEILICEFVVFVFFDFLNEAHVDKILDLFFLVLGPIVEMFVVLGLGFGVGWGLIFLFFQDLLVLLAVVVLQELLLMSSEFVLP